MRMTEGVFGGEDGSARRPGELAYDNEKPYDNLRSRQPAPKFCRYCPCTLSDVVDARARPGCAACLVGAAPRVRGLAMKTALKFALALTLLW